MANFNYLELTQLDSRTDLTIKGYWSCIPMQRLRNQPFLRNLHESMVTNQYFSINRKI